MYTLWINAHPIAQLRHTSDETISKAVCEWSGESAQPVFTTRRDGNSAHVIAQRTQDYDDHYMTIAVVDGLQDAEPLQDKAQLQLSTARWCVVLVGQLYNASTSIRHVAALVNNHLGKSSTDPTKVRYIIRTFTSSSGTSAHMSCAYLVVAQHDVRAVCGLSHTFWLLNGQAVTVRGENGFNLIPAQALPPQNMRGGMNTVPRHPVTMEELKSQTIGSLLKLQRKLSAAAVLKVTDPGALTCHKALPTTEGPVEPHLHDGLYDLVNRCTGTRARGAPSHAYLGAWWETFPTTPRTPPTPIAHDDEHPNVRVHTPYAYGAAR